MLGFDAVGRLALGQLPSSATATVTVFINFADTPLATRARKAGAVARYDDGNYFPKINFVSPGWHVQPPQAPHRRPERAGAIMRGDDGNYDIFVASTAAYVHFEPTINQPPHPRPERAGALMRGHDGTVRPYNVFYDYGFPIQPPPPPHPRPEKAGAIMRGDDGTAGRFNFFRDLGFPIQPPQPPHPRREKAGGLMRGIDGADGIYVRWCNDGWEQTATQPPHPRREKAGALMRGDDGTQSRFIFIFLYVRGWEPNNPQPPHPRPERAGAIMRGDDGIENILIIPVFPIVPIDTQGRFIAVDSNNGVVAQSRVKIGQAFNFIMAIGDTVPTGTLMLVVTKPDGTVRYVRSSSPFFFTGLTPLTAFIGDFAPRRYIVYTFSPGEADMAGTWSAYLNVGVFAYKTMYFQISRP